MQFDYNSQIRGNNIDGSHNTITINSTPSLNFAEILQSKETEIQKLHEHIKALEEYIQMQDSQLKAGREIIDNKKGFIRKFLLKT